jgi:hypothetical protein
MLDRDSQLIYEAYAAKPTTEVLSELGIPDIDPISFAHGDIVEIRIGGMVLDFHFRKDQSDRENKDFFHIYTPVKDYSSLGPLPNITTIMPNDRNIIYTNRRSYNIAADVLTGKKPSSHGHMASIKDVRPAGGGADVADKPGAAGAAGAAASRDTGRWTNDPKYKHSYRARVADHGFFKNADVNSMTGKWAAHRLEKGFQNLIAPNSDFKRTGASRFATDPKQRYTGPDSGHKMNLGSEYEDAPKNVSTGRSKYKTK